MKSELRYTATQIREEIAHLKHLRSLGPCDLPVPSSSSWSDPAWLTAWLRNNPTEIDRQIAALTMELARMNARAVTLARKANQR